MSDQKDLRNEPWAKNTPEYALEAIIQISDARHEILAAMKLINERNAELASREQVLMDREQAFVNAAADLKTFANSIYGPDSELTKLNARLEAAETAAVRREADYTKDLSHLKTWTESELRERDNRMDKFSERLQDLERKSA